MRNKFFNLKKIVIIILYCLLEILFFSCASLNSTKIESENLFLSILLIDAKKIWSPSVSQKVKDALFDYETKIFLPNGLVYGDSVRLLNLEHMCPEKIDAYMRSYKCISKNVDIKDPKTNKSLLLPNGKTIQMIVYICPDGGAVRVKQNGDVFSRFRKQPQVSKALRYPYNSKFETFDDEVVKIDNRGYAVPKWVKDLNVEYFLDNKEKFIQNWADDAHTDLKLFCD